VVLGSRSRRLLANRQIHWRFARRACRCTPRLTSGAADVAAAFLPSELCHHGVAGHAAEPWSVRPLVKSSEMSCGAKYALMVSLSALLALQCGQQCEADLHASARSPTGSHRAVEYFLDCEGATGPGSYEVSIIQGSDQLPKGSGNVITLQPTRQASARVKLRWLSERELEITYEKRAVVQQHRGSVNGVTIRYVAQPYLDQPAKSSSGA